MLKYYFYKHLSRKNASRCNRFNASKLTVSFIAGQRCFYCLWVSSDKIKWTKMRYPEENGMRYFCHLIDLLSHFFAKIICYEIISGQFAANESFWMHWLWLWLAFASVWFEKNCRALISMQIEHWVHYRLKIFGVGKQYPIWKHVIHSMIRSSLQTLEQLQQSWLSV